MDLGPCPSCGLTPLGNGLLRHELDQLQRVRPGGAWVAEVCERCEGVCAIADPEEGWTLGSPSPGPVRLVSPPGPDRPVERPSFAEEVSAPLPDPVVVIERIVAEVTGSVPRPAEPVAAARTTFPDSWAFSPK